MQQVQLKDELYKAIARRARKAGFVSVDDFVADHLESELADEQADFDSRFTPKVIEKLDRISTEMKSGQSVSGEELDTHLSEVRQKWLKDHAG